MVNQGGSCVGFIEGNESFKMVVMALKNSTGVCQNRSWKVGGRTGLHGLHRELSPFFFSFFFFFFFPSFLISDWSSFLLIDWPLVLVADWSL